jgi:hypothetical protein
MQRSAGKLTFFLAGIYLMVLFGVVVSTASGSPIPLLGWPILLLPAAAFVYSIIDAVRLHRTSDIATTTRLWRRSLLLAVIGTGVMVLAVVITNRITPV